MKKNYILNSLTTILFYVSIFLFFLAFNFQDSRTSGWYQQFLPTTLGGQIKDVYFVDSLLGFAVSDSCILKTSNGGDNWSIKLYSSFFTRIKFINNTTGYASDAFHLHKTTNSGENWTTIPLPGDLMAMDMSVLNQDTIWICNTVSLTGGAFLTTNGGVNWQQKFIGGPENPNKIYFYNSRIGFICNNTFSSSLKKTTNGGDNWFATVNEGFTDMFFIDSLTGWRAGDYIKKTTDGGLTWVQQQLPHGVNGQTIVWGIRSISKFSKDTIWGSYAYVYFPNYSARGILYRTTNGGVSWSYQLPDTAVITMPAQYNYCNFINKNIGWAYSIHNGIHTTIGGDTTFLSTMHQISNGVPKDFMLFQNFPNPFNQISKIKYQISKINRVKINVFDISGRLVQTIFDGKQSPGTYEVTFDAGNLSSGVYFYSLFIDGVRVDTKKAILIK